ncbi:hypothetical protein HDV02_002200 [Globomyces sp. JEL0801]|nr:hypothetical protein HDV02_002200 [Globomyces sp. JEL0801]
MSDIEQEIHSNWLKSSPTCSYKCYPTTTLQTSYLQTTSTERKAYAIHAVFQVHDDIDLVGMHNAVKEMMLKHDLLRSRFVPTSAGYFHVLPSEFSPTVDTANNLEEYLLADRERGFDFNDSVWFRICLITNGLSYSHVVFTIHHMLYDGYSLPIFFDQIFIAYRNQPIRGSIPFETVINFIDSVSASEACQSYWKSYLLNHTPSIGFSPLTQLPLVKTTRTSQISYATLYALATKWNTSALSITKLAWAITLKTFTMQSDVLFGNVVNGRDVPLPGVESILGLMNNLIPCRVQVIESLPISTLLSQIDEIYKAGIDFSLTKLADIQAWVGKPANYKLFDTLLTFQIADSAPLQSDLDGDDFKLPTFVKATKLQNITEYVDYGILLDIFPTAGNLDLKLGYDLNILSPMYAAQLLHFFDYALTNITKVIENDNKQALLYDVIKPSGHHLTKLLTIGVGPQHVLSWSSVAQTIESLAAMNPNSLAITAGNYSITYKQLNGYSDAFANQLISEGTIPGNYIPIISFSSIEFIVGIIAVLKCGAVAVPIDANLPGNLSDEDLRYIIDTCQTTTILYHDRIDDKFYQFFDKSKGRPLRLLEPHPLDSAPSVILDETSPAYTLFTSNDIGPPKGIILSHGSLIGMGCTEPNVLQVSKESVVGNFAPVNTTRFVTEVFCTLLAGGSLQIPRHNQYLETMKACNTLLITPSLLDLMIPSDHLNLKTVVMVSELPFYSLLERWEHQVKLYISYGFPLPTFTALSRSNSKFNCGFSKLNTMNYILDHQMSLVPFGGIGELYVGGSHFSVINDSKISSIPNHFEADGTQLYNTGMICRWSHQGELLLMGDVDAKPILNGVPIDLTQIADMLNKLSGVRRAVVLVKDDDIIAYLSPEHLDISLIIQKCLVHLPLFFIPTKFVPIDTYPLDYFGMVDIQALLHYQ